MLTSDPTTDQLLRRIGRRLLESLPGEFTHRGELCRHHAGLLLDQHRTALAARAAAEARLAVNYANCASL